LGVREKRGVLHLKQNIYKRGGDPRRVFEVKITAPKLFKMGRATLLILLAKIKSGLKKDGKKGKQGSGDPKVGGKSLVGRLCR